MSEDRTRYPANYITMNLTWLNMSYKLLGNDEFLRWVAGTTSFFVLFPQSYF